MLVLTVEIKIEPDKRAVFEDAFTELVRGISEHEPGMRSFLFTRVADTADSYIAIEVYEDDAALDAHTNATHSADAKNRMRSAFAGPPKITRSIVLASEGKGVSVC